MAAARGVSSSLAVAGDWVLEAPVGRGATSVVYRASHRESGVQAAVKVLAAGIAPGEAELLARLGRRWGPALLDVGRLPSGQTFLATEWTEGEPLAVAAREGEQRALIVAHAVGRALAELHASGVRHGDVKPANVLWHGRKPARDVPTERGATLIDLGLATRVGAAARGGTARYAAPELARGADVGPRADLFALGVMLAELLEPALATATDPAARVASWTGKGDIARVAALLLSPHPGARPDAAWVADRAARLLALPADPAEPGEARAAEVRRAYLALRAPEIAGATGVADDVRGPARGWLEEACSLARRIRPAEGESLLGASSALVRSRWLVALVGAAAAAWPVDTVAEDVFADRLLALARERPFSSWTLADLRGARPAALERGKGNATDRAVALALALARANPRKEALAEAEAMVSAHPAPALALALAEALARAGEIGRARLALDGIEGARAEVLRAELARRAGDRAGAEKAARAALAQRDAPAGLASRAASVLGRLAWDTGDDAGAARALEGHAGPAPAEVAALVAYRHGAFDAGLRVVADALPLCDDALSRARLESMRGYLEHAAGRSRPALEAYARAVDLATQCGAVPEEATYLVGEAASALDAGDVGRGIRSATRGALLLERLGRFSEASVAWLGRAGAFAALGATHEADVGAGQAMALAGPDARARAFARWARVETRPEGDPVAREESLAARADLATSGVEDRVRAEARALVWAPDAVDADAIRSTDRASAAASGAARWEWWGARARRIVAGGGEGEGAAEVLAALVGLVDTPAPLWWRGPALAAGRDLAMKLGDGEAARRLEALRREAASRLRETTPPEHADQLTQLAWMRDVAREESGLLPEQIGQLETIVRSLSYRERLRPLLEQVLDAMVLWVGVERGLLLLRAPPRAGDDAVRLVPRAARNLAREDLRGEQLALSMTLARRAMESGEAVVATDAFSTMGDVHASVHALRLRSVLAVPLVARGETLGVVYLDDRGRRGAFGPRELSWVSLLASQAALAIADARDQALLRRAARRAERAQRELAGILSDREAELFVTRTELEAAKGEATRFRYDRIAGRSEPMRELLRVVDRVTTSDVPVLVVGESGTGKELIARAMHENGPRARRPFVSENCAAVPETLLESALFGHVKGAFTGASQTRPGLFEVADGGTLFLDEIGEMPLSMQAKLLRVLQDGEVRPVGSDRMRRVNVRLVAATHRDLEAMVQKRSFREDLYYRLNVVTVRVPSLRERRPDIPLIVSHLLARHAPGRKVRVTRAAMDRLVAFPWPGNVRQLENEVRRALVLLSTSGEHEAVIDVGDLSPEVVRGGPDAAREAGLDLRARVDLLETELLREALAKTQGNQTRAAELLGLSRFGLQKMMRRLKILAKGAS